MRRWRDGLGWGCCEKETARERERPYGHLIFAFRERKASILLCSEDFTKYVVRKFIRAKIMAFAF